MVLIKQTIPVLLVYERSEAVARKSDLHKQWAAVFPQPAGPNTFPLKPIDQQVAPPMLLQDLQSPLLKRQLQ